MRGGGGKKLRASKIYIESVIYDKYSTLVR